MPEHPGRQCRYRSESKPLMNRRRIAVACLVLAVVAAGIVLIVRQKGRETARRQVESAALRIPGVRAIDYDSAEIDWKGSGARIRSATVSLVDPPQDIRIDEILVHDVDLAHEIPDRLDVDIRGVHLDADQPRLAALHPYLAGPGKAELVLDLHCRYRYDRSQRRLAVETLRIDVADAGRLELRIELLDIDLPHLVRHLSDRIYLITALPGVSLAAAELDYTDATLARRLLAAWAARTGRSPEEAAEALAGDLQQLIGGTDRPITRKAVEGIKTFIEDPGTLHVAAAPPAPVSFFNFLWARQPSDVIELLHIRVRG